LEGRVIKFARLFFGFRRQKMANQPNAKSNLSLLFIFPVYCAIFFLWALARVPLVLYVIGYNAISYIGLLMLLVVCVMIVVQLFRRPSKLFRGLGIVLLIFTCPVNCLSVSAIAAMPDILDTANINGIKYYLVAEPEALDIHVYYSLYKCTSFGFKCSPTSFYWGPTTGDIDLHLMQDENNPNEIYVLKTHYSNDASDLMYSDGTQSIYYDYASSSQVGNHLYYLAYIRVPNTIYREHSRIYKLYQCNLDNTNCIRLPFEYQSMGTYTTIDTNETTGEIKIFIDSVVKQDTLIYTYGENPHCYVDGCIITDK
jgi:hypothetical protein